MRTTNTRNKNEGEDLVDIHCHILPSLDDGAKSYQEAIEMARIAWSDGITDIIATPHTRDGLHDQQAAVVLESIQQLRLALEQENILVRIHPGMEIHAHAELVENLFSGEIFSLGNEMKYVLLEFPSTHFPLFSHSLISHLLDRGITPVIAHPERIEVFRHKPSLLREWTSLGAIGQVTAGSLLGFFGQTARASANEFVKQRLVHVIASDGHHTRTRRPELSAAYEALQSLLPEEEVNLFRTNAKAILHGEALPILPALGKTRQRRWFFF